MGAWSIVYIGEHQIPPKPRHRVVHSEQRPTWAEVDGTLIASESVWEEAPVCGAIDAVGYAGTGPVCTEPPGHHGDHVATDPETGREVTRWAAGG